MCYKGACVLRSSIPSLMSLTFPSPPSHELLSDVHHL